MAKNKWVVDWQNKQPSIIQDISNPDERKPRKVLKDDKAKFAWIESLTADDEIFTELGASADILCAMALKKDVTIHRIQTRLLKEWRTQQGMDKSDSFASLLYFAQNKPGEFYDMPLAVRQVLGLQCNIRHFEITQEMRKSEAHRLRQVATMEFYLNEMGKPAEDTPEAMTKDEQKEALAKVTEIMDQARSTIVEQFKGKVDEKTLRKIAAQLTPSRQARVIVKEATSQRPKDTDLQIYLQRRFAESDIFWGVDREEEFYAREVEKMLEGMDVYTKVYKKIPGMGPKVAGRIIAAIGDIRRFPKAFSLACYFGYHVRADGTCPRRQKGIGQPDKRKEMADKGERSVDYGGWNELGRQGLFLWAEQVNKATPNLAPKLYEFKEKQVVRKAYVARKNWRLAAEQVAKAAREPSESLQNFLLAFQMVPETWLHSGEPLIEGADNPYLICAREPQVVQSPWLLRDALAELLKKAGDTDVGEDEEDEDDLTALLEGAENPEQDAPKPKKAPEKTKFVLPKLELSDQMKREIRAVIKNPLLSKKRIHLGSYRWLINNVLIRKHIWPLNRELVGLSKDCDPTVNHSGWRERKAQAQATEQIVNPAAI